MPSQWVEWAVRSAEPVEVGAVKVTPWAHSLRAGWPGGGFVWNHPAFVIVERNGSVERLPVVDVVWIVRLALVALMGVCMLGSAVWAIRAIRSRRNCHG